MVSERSEACCYWTLNLFLIVSFVSSYCIRILRKWILFGSLQCCLMIGLGVFFRAWHIKVDHHAAGSLSPITNTLHAFRGTISWNLRENHRDLGYYLEIGY